MFQEYGDGQMKIVPWGKKLNLRVGLVIISRRMHQTYTAEAIRLPPAGTFFFFPRQIWEQDQGPLALPPEELDTWLWYPCKHYKLVYVQLVES